MKRISLICLLIFLCNLQGYSQFWISFNWNVSHCDNCLWMEQALHLSSRRVAEYHRIIHKYGKKIEQEARRDIRYWERSAERIYKLRMERDRALQRLLSPSEFRLYVRFIREAPTRIHDYRGWFNNPHYPHYHPSANCHHYEDSYWGCNWSYNNGHWSSHYRRQPPCPHVQPQRPPRHPRDNGQWRPDKYDRPNRNKDKHPGKYDDKHYQKDYKKEKRNK